MTSETDKFKSGNITELKREAAVLHEKKIADLMHGKPMLNDRVRFSTAMNGNVITDTGTVTKVYTKNKCIRYMVESDNSGTLLIYFNSPDKYPLDNITKLG